MPTAIDRLMDEDPSGVFVFGSNLQGGHGAGAAKTARQHYGAVMGQGYGMCGRSFAIPTRSYSGRKIVTLGLRETKCWLLAAHAQMVDYDDLTFYWTRVGCGLAGFTDEQMARCLVGLPRFDHIVLPAEWEPYL